MPPLTDEEKVRVTIQLRAGFVFLSGVLYEPPKHFWELPQTFLPAQRQLEAVARAAGLGVLTLDERRENWRQAVLGLKGFVEPYGIEFPALPGSASTAAGRVDPEDLIPVFEAIRRIERATARRDGRPRPGRRAILTPALRPVVMVRCRSILHAAVSAPSTTRFTPVVKLDAGLARSTAAFATS